MNPPFLITAKIPACTVQIFCSKSQVTSPTGRRIVNARVNAVTGSPLERISQTQTSHFAGKSNQTVLLHTFDQHVSEIVKRQSECTNSAAAASAAATATWRKPNLSPELLEEAYERCRNICAEYAKTFYLGTLLMTDERQEAIWAIYVWCRRTDELVDGPNAIYMSSAVLDGWEERLQDIFEGRPYDILDAALTDTVSKFPLDIKPFKDMIEGMRMDTRKSRYENFSELYSYCYYVAGTVGLMSVPIMGIAHDSSFSAQSIYIAALNLGIGNQLTNILRDVGEDALRGRIYLPQDELAQFGLSDKDVFSKRITNKWKQFMKEQIRRARFYFNLAEEGASQLDKASRWPVWSSLLIYREILDAIEENGYDNLTRRAYVGRMKKLRMLPLAYIKAQSTINLTSFHGC